MSSPSQRLLDFMRDADDAELIERLRAGNMAAYEELWARHIDAALRVARRIAPSEAEDVTAEAFLAVYHQIADLGKGPDAAFRAYLFTTIRHAANRHRTAQTKLAGLMDEALVLDDPSSSRLEQGEEHRTLLTAFHALPKRWQRVLWLTEVEDVPRESVAKQLGIPPNAVSALTRRARKGLQMQWLTAMIPVTLGSSTEHVANLLPKALMSGNVLSSSVQEHLSSCDACAKLYSELRLTSRSMRGRTLAKMGFAALGVTVPTAWSALFPPAVATAAAVILLGTSAGALIAAQSLGFIPSELSGSGPVQPPALAANSTGDPLAAPSVPLNSPAQTAAPMPPEAGTDENLPPQQGLVLPAPSSLTATLPADDPVTINLTPDISGALPPIFEYPPQPASPGTVPGPAFDAGGEQGSVASPNLDGLPAKNSYTLPVVTGTTAPNTQVAVAVAQNTYLVSTSEDGAWTFNFAPLKLAPGLYTVDVWAFDDEETSIVTSFSFELAGLHVDNWPEFEPMVLSDAMDEGLVFSISGEPGGIVCLASDSGQTAEIELDGSGQAARRIQFFGYGYYILNLTACTNEQTGASYNSLVQVTEGIFDPWIVGDPEIFVSEVSE